MLDETLTDPRCIIAISMFSLAWFIVGLSAGKRLAPTQTSRPERKKPRTSKQKKEGKSELYVGNLSYDLSSKDLRRLFEQYGKVSAVRLIENRFTGKSKGFAFVEMANEPDVRAAIKALNGKEQNGRKLVVNVARTRPND